MTPKARLQIRLRQTRPLLYIVEVWRRRPFWTRVRELGIGGAWELISETPQIPEGVVDREFSRAFQDYKGDPLTMAWTFVGLRDLPAYPDQLDADVKRGRKVMRRVK